VTLPATTLPLLVSAGHVRHRPPGRGAQEKEQHQAWESEIFWPSLKLAPDGVDTLRALYRFASAQHHTLRVCTDYVRLGGASFRGYLPQEAIASAALRLRAVERAVAGLRAVPAMTAIRIPGSAPADLDLADLAAVAAPALLLLLWSPEASPRLYSDGGSVWLVSSARCPAPVSALSLAAALVTALIEQSDLPPATNLLRFPFLVKTTRDAAASVQHCIIAAPSEQPIGRMSRLRAVGMDRAVPRMTAQQALSVTVYATEESLARLLNEDDFRSGVALAHGERALPIDAVRGVRRPPLLVPAAPERRTRTRPLVLVVSPATRPPGKGSTEAIPALAGLNAHPRALGWSHLRIARGLAQGNADVFVVPWYEIQFSSDDVWVHGLAMRLRSDGTAHAELFGPERPDSMVMYPAAGQGMVGSTPVEAAAAERLQEQGLWPASGSRQAVVARVLHAAARRGVMTNASGPEGVWWRKDRLELALRWWTRQTGRVVTRPETAVVSARYVPLTLETFARRGWTAIVKPSAGARAEGVHIIRPGEQAPRVWPHGTYIVQRLVAAPYLAAGRKIDLRAYILVDSASRSRSKLLPLILVRRAPLDWVQGAEVAEITNSSFKERLGLPPQIYPLELCPGISEPLRAEIIRSVDGLSDELLDALFAWRRGSRHNTPHTRRALIWGIDVLLQHGASGVEPTLLEVNVYPQMFRGDPVCDRAVEDLFGNELLPALRTRRSTLAAGRKSLVMISLLTTRTRSSTVRELTRACDRLGAQLVATSSELAPSTLAAFHWGLDVPALKRSLNTVGAACDNAGVRLINAVSYNKFEQVKILTEAGVPVPETSLVNGLFEAATEAGRIGFPLIIKPLNGSYSRGVRMVDNDDRLIHCWPGGRQLLQAFLPEGYRCARILVVGDKVVSGVVRVALDGLLATYDHGRRATIEPLEMTDELTDLARRACRALAIDVGGVDVVLDERGPVVLEVNHHGVEFDVAALHGASAVAEVARFLVESAHASLTPPPVP
jgi:glutathione synthase/RimK-type ligase-like ATP-grasp enzyme